MKLSEKWLREWVDPGVDTATLAHQLTMAGLNVDTVSPAIEGSLDGIVVARVDACFPHPNADKLTVCDVHDGKGKRRIICGAPDVKPGMLAPLALPGTRLPGGAVIEMREVRGILSDGMLCSAAELGLSDDAANLMALPADAEPGSGLAQVLDADDLILDIDLTPNRGDCLSVLGVAREVAAINGLEVQDVEGRMEEVESVIEDMLEVEIEDLQDCPVYCGRIVKGVDATRTSPLWMQERLRRAGVRPLNAVVDVTAYVMLELGQPLHAFDLDRLTGPVRVRRGREGERLALLDGTQATIDTELLVIADAGGPVALAGVMGGADSAVSRATTDVFLECACFNPLVVSGRARRLGVHSEAAHRFERGVDPELAAGAIERATRLLLEFAGGEPGPVNAVGDPLVWTGRNRPITLRRDRITRLLGMSIDDDEVVDLLRRLSMHVKAEEEGWRVTPPGFRFDITIEADLVEEVARLHGYERIPARDAAVPAVFQPVPEARVPDARLRDALVQRGYQEAITYSFVDAALQGTLQLDGGALDLVNPISEELGQMRTSLWPGLLGCLGYNLKRQQSRVRIFEHGLTFIAQGDEIKQDKYIAALAYGDRSPEQWGLAQARVDFYDLKGDLEALCAAGGDAGAYHLEAAAHPCLHPGQSARILHDDTAVGWIGVLHPGIARRLDLPHPLVLFEVAMAALTAGRVPRASGVSRFPALRRDLALVVPEAVTVGELLAQVRDGAPEWLDSAHVFDIYRGQGIEEGLKSIALGLILQDSSRTLTDEEVDAYVQRLVGALGQTLRATLRE